MNLFGDKKPEVSKQHAPTEDVDQKIPRDLRKLIDARAAAGEAVQTAAIDMAKNLEECKRLGFKLFNVAPIQRHGVHGKQIFDFYMSGVQVDNALLDFLAEQGFGKRAMPGGVVKTFSESISEANTMLLQAVEQAEVATTATKRAQTKDSTDE